MTDQKKSFEAAISELETLIAEVENGSLPLEKMIDRITQGAELIKYCQAKLNAMNGKVEILFNDNGSNGEFTEFDPETTRSRAAGVAESAPAPRTRRTAKKTTQDELPL